MSIIGGGIAGAWTALLLAKAGRRVTLYERGPPDISAATSWWAGGMLAPDCEAEGAEPIVVELGRRALNLWRAHCPEDVVQEGSLVVAHPRDRADFERFARMTRNHRRLDAEGIGEVEPLLEGRFREALFYPGEAHVEPRRALASLHGKLEALGVERHFNVEVDPASLTGIVVDCRGGMARDVFPDLRGVKGEIVVVKSAEIALTRPVRLLHPRWPLYIVPRADHRFMIGATTIEREDEGVSVRSALELLTAAYALHPAFGEARIVEIGSGLRPAFPDNCPRIDVRGERIAVNGLYRHGFLMAPALAEIVTAYIQTGQRDNEVMRWS